MEQKPQDNHPEIQQLIEAFKQDNDREIHKLYSNYQDEFIAWSRRETSLEEEEFKIIFQDCIVDLYKKAVNDKLVGIHVTVKTYLFAIAKKKILKRYQNRARFSFHEEVPESILGDGDNVKIYRRMDQDHLKEKMKGALGKLGRKCQTILQKYFYKNYSLEAVAHAMNYKNNQVASVQIYKCLQKLKQNYSPE